MESSLALCQKARIKRKRKRVSRSNLPRWCTFKLWIYIKDYNLYCLSKDKKTPFLNCANFLDCPKRTT